MNFFITFDKGYYILQNIMNKFYINKVSVSDKQKNRKINNK